MDDPSPAKNDSTPTIATAIPASASATNGRNKPCQQCRSRKLKCVVDRPGQACNRCADQGVQCFFADTTTPTSASSRKRGAAENGPSNDHLATLPPSKRAVSSDKTSRHSSTNRSPALEAFNGRDSAFPPDSLLNQTLGLARYFHARHMGATAPFPALLVSMNHRTESTGIGGDALRQVGELEYYRLRDDTSTESHALDELTLDQIQQAIAPNGRALIDLYFRIVHPSFPILHKKVFYEKYGRGYQEFSPPLLAAVYILALQWWDFSPLAGSAKPDVKALKVLAARSLHSIILERPKLSTVQACLLLGQVHGEQSYTKLAQVVAVALDLGLHLNCSTWQIPSWEKGLRKRLAWAVFMQDMWASMLAGKPRLIHRPDWFVEPITDLDFPESAADEDDEDGSTGVEQGRVIFKHFNKLSELLANTSDALSGGEIMHEAELWALVDRFNSCQGLISSWPVPHDLDLANVQSRKLCSTGYVHLARAAILCTLCRVVLRRTHRLQAHDAAQEFRRQARNVLADAISLMQQLRPEHLQSFWYFASPFNLLVIGTLACDLWATSRIHSERDDVRKLLEDFRWSVRMNAKSADFMVPVVATLGEFIKVINFAQRLVPSNAGVASAGPMYDASLLDPSDTASGAASYSEYSPMYSSLESPASLGFTGLFDFINEGFVSG